jgi:hypothetical protein
MVVFSAGNLNTCAGSVKLRGLGNESLEQPINARLSREIARRRGPAARPRLKPPPIAHQARSIVVSLSFVKGPDRRGVSTSDLFSCDIRDGIMRRIHLSLKRKLQ